MEGGVGEGGRGGRAPPVFVAASPDAALLHKRQLKYVSGYRDSSRGSAAEIAAAPLAFVKKLISFQQTERALSHGHFPVMAGYMQPDQTTCHKSSGYSMKQSVD
ncbi:hypothetical protein INR49_030286 [Caranx melampygus]|nr:hypothetical protein INR49_030286 [Caranx melampygus]